MVGFVCWPLSLEVLLMMHFIISIKEVVKLEHFKMLSSSSLRDQQAEKS
jgi:hypothetical protein